MSDSPMHRNSSLERSIAGWMADEAATDMRSDARVIDQILTATGRVRPLPPWLALLKEPPMRIQTAVAVGSPTPRLLLVAALIALLALAAGVAVVGSNLLHQTPRPTSAFVQRFSAPGVGFGAPAIMAADSRGNLWVPDTDHGRFAIFKPDGTFVEFWGQPGTGEASFNLKKGNGDGYGSIAFEPDGSFYVLDVGNFRVQQFDAGRNPIGTWGTAGDGPLQYRDPTGIVIAGDGTVYVLDDARNVIEHVSRDGSLIADTPIRADVGESGFSTNALTIDKTGNLYISRAGPWRVDKLDPAGRLLATYGASGPGALTAQANGVVFDAHGHVIVAQGPQASYADLGIHVFDANGAYVLGFGAFGTKEGQLSFPTGLVLDGQGNLYVEDPAVNNGTISKFELGAPLYP
jgi:streptogramin lyase